MVIAGGGISGLALAAALQAAPEASRPKVIVMERDASAEARRQGYGVTLSETNAALAGLGILEDLRASSTRSCAHWTFKDDGAVLGYFGLAFLPEERRGGGGVTNLRVPRNRVREILLRRLLPGTVRFGCRVVDYEEVTSEEKGGSDVTVFVETVKQSDAPVGGGAGRPEWAENDARSGRATSRRNDSSATETLRGVSLLVASDGARSAVQRRRMPGASLNYLGVVLITGFTTLAHPLLEKQGFYTLDGARARIFTMPFETPNAEADGSEAGPKTNENACVRKSMWQISVRVAEAEARALAKAPRSLPNDATELERGDPFVSVRAFVRSVAGTWHAPVPAMFDATDWETCWAGPLYDRDEPPKPPTGANARSRVTAIGDAAHPMSPFKGMGANTALFDAWHLARWLRKAPPPRACACFEREMFARAWAKVRASREACVAFHSETAVRGPNEFAGVSPESAKSFLASLAERGVGAALGAQLEAETKTALLEFRAAATNPQDDGAKPYAYLKRNERRPDDGSDDNLNRDAASSEKEADSRREIQIRRTRVGSSRRRVPPPALASRVEDAFHEAVRRVGAAPLTADETAVARTLVAAAASRKARPAHDWTSRAALKIAHGREKKNPAAPETEPSAPVSDAERADGPDALAARLARVCAEVLVAEASLGEGPAKESLFSTLDATKNAPVASARAAPDGQLFVVSGARRAALARSGLATCVGCGKFFAVHGGGLRQHWARGGDSTACAAAAAAAANASMTDAEASAATGGLVGAAVESSSWRGAGEGRPGPWRDAMRAIERDGDASDDDAENVSVATVAAATASSRTKFLAPANASSSSESKELRKLRRRSAGLAAAAIGDVAAMRAAFEAGAFDPVADADPHGSGALHWAAGGGHLEACEWLARERGVPVDATRRKDGRAPLHWAARNGRLDVCAWLVSRGADANRCTYDGDTPFNLAVWQGRDEVARYLVGAENADPKRRNRWGCNALLWACTRTREEDANVGGVEGSHPGSVLGTVAWLVDALGVPADVVNVNGHGAIHKCAIYGHGDVIDWLVRRDAEGKRPSLDARHFAPDDRNSKPSDLALTNGHVALSSKLRVLEDQRSRVPVVYDGGG